jgi:hypothetical protein
MKPLDVRKKVDFIPMPIELRGRSDKEIMKRTKRTSPDLSKMERIKDPDGTVWGFCSPAKAKKFANNRDKLLDKGSHFLSGREILESLYS